MALGEFELIAKYFAGALAGRSDVVLGVGDDAALLRAPAGQELAVTADTIVAGVHFPNDIAPDAIGHRALAVNLSDLAAMGVTPAWFTLALTLPCAEEAWVAPFSDGLLRLARQHEVALVGGDTTSGPLAVTVQAMGHCAPGAAIRRSGARAGDAIFVSGTLGDAAAGLAVLQGQIVAGSSDARAQLVERFLWPIPRVALGLALIGIASAAIDVSDGLLGDLDKLLLASKAGAHVDVDALPLSAALRQIPDESAARRFASCGGDDYELCFTVPEGKVDEVGRIGWRLQIPLTRIGTVETVRGLRCFSRGQPVELQPSGFDHFAR